jgi:hypothetical protein
VNNWNQAMGLEQAVRLEPVIEDKEPVVAEVEVDGVSGEDEDDEDTEDGDEVDEDITSSTSIPTIDEDTP